MKPTSDKKLIDKAIIQFFTERTGQFHGLDLLRYVRRSDIKRYVYPDTVLRYMRFLNAKEVISYRQIGMKADSLYEIVKHDKNHV